MPPSHRVASIARAMNPSNATAESDERPSTPASPVLMLERFAQVVERAAADPRFGERLALARTTVLMQLGESEEMMATMIFDRHPVSVRPGVVGDPEIEIRMSPEEFERFWSDGVHPAMAIAQGRISYEGPVRKILRVVPILRRVRATYSEGTGEGTGAGEGADDQ